MNDSPESRNWPARSKRFCLRTTAVLRRNRATEKRQRHHGPNSQHNEPSCHCCQFNSYSFVFQDYEPHHHPDPGTWSQTRHLCLSEQSSGTSSPQQPQADRRLGNTLQFYSSEMRDAATQHSARKSNTNSNHATKYSHDIHGAVL